MNLSKPCILEQMNYGNYRLFRSLVTLKASPVKSSKIFPASCLSKTNPIFKQPAAFMNIVHYADIKDLPKHPEKVLIDVREPAELKHGFVPGSINIPLKQISRELGNSVTPEEFKKKYGRSKPSFDSFIIMMCRSGKRAASAVAAAEIMGYKNVHNYQGSWLDYAKHQASQG